MALDFLEFEIELTSLLQLLVLADGLQLLVGVPGRQNLLGLLLQLLLVHSVQFLGLKIREFFATCPICALISAYMCFTTDGMARIFSLTPLPRPGIKLTSDQLYLLRDLN